MYSGMTDVGVLEADSALLNSVYALWNDIVSSKIYLTGGVGARHHGEAFSDPFDLPNASAYCETCAASGNIFWNHRLYNFSKSMQYMDVLETTLYNGFLAGISLDGRHFFYPNPLETDGDYMRSDWFEVACCPSNLSRVIPSIPAYIYSKDDNGLYVNLFINSEAEFDVKQTACQVEMKTNYPWEGKVKIILHPKNPQKFRISIRIPGWTKGRFIPGGLYTYVDQLPQDIYLNVNGKKETITNDSLIILNRKWKKGDEIELVLPLKPRLIKSDRRITENEGRLAIVNGPLVYAIEGIDNGGSVKDSRIDADQDLQQVYEDGLLNGVTRIRTGNLIAIPYYSWANRGSSDMKVWIPEN